jgi:two-component system OmpR family sensor kinase
MSLRGRLLAHLTFVAIVSCALTVVVGAVLVRHRVADQRIAQLRNQAAVLALVGGAPGARRAGEHVYRVGVRRPHPAPPGLARAVLAAVPAHGDAQGSIHVRRVTLLYASRTTALGRIVLVRRAGLRFADWRPFLGALLLAGLGGAVLAALLSLVLARRLTRPIAALARATRRLAAGEREVTVPVRSGDDELAELGRSFNRMSAELSRARESQRAFLESVSHEFKTPLTSVRGYAEALEERAVGAAEGGRVIAAEARRLDRLVSDLLDLARMGRAGFEAKRAPIDLGALAEAAVTRHRVRAAELGLRLVARTAPCAWGAGDEGRLLQATSNLIENALRLTPAGGEVTVGAAPGVIIVTDTGPGLAEEDLPHAFERFYLHDRYRADPERSVGSGLGLAIVAELVAAMGGRVTAANRPGGGASFRVDLPPARAPVSRDAAPVAEP